MQELVFEHIFLTGVLFVLILSTPISVAAFWASVRAANILLSYMPRWLAMFLSFIWNIISFYILSALVWDILVFTENNLTYSATSAEVFSVLFSYFLGFGIFLFFSIESITLMLRVYRLPVSPRVAWQKALWRSVWPLGSIVLCLFVIGVALDVPATSKQDETAATIAAIQSQKITMADVLGTNLPPVPYEPENDATVAGIDKNNNGIRDDVELAIFAKYPNDPKIRAAELQYAMTEQMFLTDVFNSDTWKAVAIQDDRGYECVGNSVPNSGNLSRDLKIVNSRINEVEALVFNTQIRKDAKDKAYSFTTSYGQTPGVPDCDIDINLL